MIKPKTYEAKMEDDGPTIIGYPDMAFTDSLGPCLGIGLLNKTSKKGYLQHIYFGDNYKKVIEQAISEAERPEELELVLAGNVPTPKSEIFDVSDVEDFRKDESNQRKNLLKYLDYLEIPKNNIRTYLPAKPSDNVYKITVNTNKMKIYVEKKGY
jgi:hypothetical protein